MVQKRVGETLRGKTGCKKGGGEPRCKNRLGGA